MPNMNFRTTDEQKKAIENKAREYKFESVAQYIKFVCLNTVITSTAETEMKEKTK